MNFSKLRDKFAELEHPVLYRPFDDKLAEEGKDWHYYAETKDGRGFSYPAAIISLERFHKASSNFKVLYFDAKKMNDRCDELQDSFQDEVDSSEEDRMVAISSILADRPRPPWDLIEVRLVHDDELVEIIQIVYAFGDGRLNEKGETMFDTVDFRRFNYRSFTGDADFEQFLELVSVTSIAYTDTGWAISPPLSSSLAMIPYNVGKGETDIQKAMSCATMKDDPDVREEMVTLMFEGIRQTLMSYWICSYIHSVEPKQYDPESAMQRKMLDVNNDQFLKEQKYLAKRVVKVLKQGTTGTIDTGEGTKHGHMYEVRGHWRRKGDGGVTWVKAHKGGVGIEQEVQIADGIDLKKTVEKNTFFDSIRVLRLRKVLLPRCQRTFIWIKKLYRDYILLGRQ